LLQSALGKSNGLQEGLVEMGDKVEIRLNDLFHRVKTKGFMPIFTNLYEPYKRKEENYGTSRRN